MNGNVCLIEIDKYRVAMENKKSRATKVTVNVNAVPLSAPKQYE